MSRLQNESTTHQDQGEIEDQPVPTPIKIQYLQAALLGHPDQNIVTQLCNNFSFGVHIGFQGQPAQDLKKTANSFCSQ